MLYPHRATPTLDDSLFRDPPAVYRGTPFWSWNGRLDPDLLCRQMDTFRAMGLGGGHMHPRTGLATPYLGPEYLACVKAVVEHCRQTGMLAWLYDEDRWPSGFAGGLVTSDERYRLRSLRLTPHPYTAQDRQDPHLRRGLSRREGTGTLLTCYAIRLDEDGRLASSRQVSAEEPLGEAETRWYAYREISPSSSWHNHQSYVDTLNPEAIDRFIAVTHEAYRAVVGEDFGGIVPAIFTDEPQMHPCGALTGPWAQEDVVLPWTDDLPQSYQAAWAEDLLAVLPQMLWELPEGAVAAARWRLRDHLSERFASAFADRIGAWCETHQLASTGHLMCEQSLAGQVQWVGECMRHYRSFQVPGIDILCDHMELSTAKQAASVAHQDGREGVLSELYGVTNWDFPFAGHKRQGDWQAALGITVRVHHLTWMTMKGNAKRDYPASIGDHMPWVDRYRVVEDHFARVNTVLTRGRPLVRIGIIHPVESAWLVVGGPRSQTGVEAEDLEQAFQGILRDLLFAQLDADFIAESLLPQQCPQVDGPVLTVGQMAYDVVLVPHLRTIRSSTLERLEALVAAGGRVCFVGRIPDHVDAQPSDRAQALASRCQRLDRSRAALLAALEPYRELRVSRPDGSLADDVLSQMRIDGDRRHLFLCCTRAAPGLDEKADGEPLRLWLRGHWQVTRNDTASGERCPIAHRHDDHGTELCWPTGAAGSLLLTLDPAPAASPAALPQPRRWQTLGEMADPLPVSLSEPNVLVLDRAESRLDDGPWQPIEEIHRAENRLRAALGWAPKTGGVAQPWCEPACPVEHSVTWRCCIDSTVAVTGAHLALEDSDQALIRLDGHEISVVADGCWVDACLATIPLPDLAAGQHVLEVRLPFSPSGSLEWMYLLGDFGVELRGRHARLSAPVRSLAWGDWTHQGLPFYAGNVTYHSRWQHDGGSLALHVPHMRAPVLGLAIDGQDCGTIAYDPFRLDLGSRPAGELQVDLTAYGSRINAFGALHNADPRWQWWGPPSWETTGDRWSEEYRLWACGILTAPRWQGLA